MTNNDRTDDIVELRAILGVLRRQFRVVAYAMAACMALAALFLALVDKKYTATALLEVQPAGRSILQGISAPGTQKGDDSARIESEVEIIRSDAIALAVIDDLGLSADPEFQRRQSLPGRLASFVGRANASGGGENADLFALARFRDAVAVKRKGLTNLITVAAVARDPEKARDLANRVAELHIAHQIQTKVDATLAARDVLNSQIGTARAQLNTSEANLDHFLIENLPELVRAGAVDATLEAQLGANRRQFEAGQNVMQTSRAAVEAGDWAKVSGVFDDAGLSALAAQKLENGADLANAFDKLDARLAAKVDGYLNQMDVELARLDLEADQMTSELRASLDVRNLPADLVTELYTIRQEAGIARNQYDVLLAQSREMEAEAGLQLATTHVVSPAVLPVQPSFPDPGLVMLFALGASAALGVGLAFLNEYFVGGITSETHLASVLNIPAAVSVPFADETSGGRFSPADRIIDMPLTGYAEAFRKLRAAIDLGLRDRSAAPGTKGRGRVIMVTSAQTGEGKTTAALALARTYAVAGKKTLLIDADLRRPAVHTQLGVEPASGFGQYLSDPGDNDTAHEFYARDPASSLALILGSERAMGSTDDLLNSNTFAAIVDQARAVYDVTIIDTPPVLPVVDALYIAPFADAVVTAIRWASTSQSDVKAAIDPVRKTMRSDAVLLPILTMAHTRPSPSAYGLYDGDYSAAT